MGCDIHLHIELKVKGKWIHYNNPSIVRDYRLFAKMGGVRNDEEYTLPICNPKGLPEDISEITFIAYKKWEDDGHNFSWLSSDEICLLSDWLKYLDIPLDLEYNILRSYLFDNSYKEFFNFPEDYPSDLEDFRFVFWFDN